MEKNILWYREKQINRTIENLRKKNMAGYYVNNREELLELMDQLIDKKSVVGVGDSLTLKEMGLLDYLRSEDITFLDKYKDGLTSEEKRDIYIKNFSADTFMTGTNAITEKGELFNIDGNGSRVAPMLYGPKQVIVVVGINKIVKDLDEATKRVRHYAAPIDAKRLNKNTPCCQVGFCVDCKSPERICNDFVTITGQFEKDRIKVIIVGMELGY